MLVNYYFSKMLWFWLLVVTAALIAISYWKLVISYNYWTRKGVQQSNPPFLLGDVWGAFIRKYSAPELTDKLYRMGANLRYFGVYQFLTPTLVLRDPELIKQITIKDFDHFVDHRGFVAAESGDLLSKNLLTLKGKKWREMRSTVSSSFTSSKMKYMFSLMSQSGEKFINYFLKMEENVIHVEMRDVVTKFSNDAIANTVFGFDCNSLEHPDNEFFQRGTEAADFTSLRKLLVFMGYMTIPKLLEFFKVKLFSNEMETFFRNVVKENIDSRERFQITRPDMISVLLEARKQSLEQDESPALPDTGFAATEESEIGRNQRFRKTDITNEDITSQAFVFFFAGLDFISSTICYMSYELAVNQDVQEKLRQEVDETKAKCQGEITYEAITTMKYMDMVVTETLRKWPVAIATDRVCTKRYTIEPKSPNEKTVVLEKNDLILIPIYAIHRDPHYYPEPERFDPERFSEENRKKIVPYTYLPFGSGPRNCIGSRFSLLAAKILCFYILSYFEIIPIEKTQIPIRFNRKTGNMGAEKGFWLGLSRR